jgi:hypothetical protein
MGLTPPKEPRRTTALQGPLRLLVFGGRDYTGRWVVRAALDRIQAKHGVALVIHGDAGASDPKTGEVLAGADRFGGEWATDHGIPVLAISVTAAEWRQHGLYAGPQRNERLLVEGKPQAAVGFPRASGEVGRGTTDMAVRLTNARVPVWWPKARAKVPA